MSKGIKIGKYGLNPTMPVCFWCGRETGEIALIGEIRDKFGEEIEMPMHACISYEPCDECKKHRALGYTVIEVTDYPNGNPEIYDGAYPTGRWCVIKTEAARRIFPESYIKYGKALVEEEAYGLLFEV